MQQHAISDAYEHSIVFGTFTNFSIAFAFFVGFYFDA